MIESADYFAGESLDTALRFLDAVETTFVFVAENPEMGALCRFESAHAERIRSWPIKGLEKHLMFYQPVPNGIEVVRVLHGARDLETILLISDAKVSPTLLFTR